MDGTVLIIDADPHARTVAEILLRLRGAHVRCATTAIEANEIVRREDVTVVLLDVGSPATHGLEILRQLRARSNQLRIAVVTDWEEAAVERLARRLGADVFLRKPIRSGALVRAVEELLAMAAPRFGLRVG